MLTLSSLQNGVLSLVSLKVKLKVKLKARLKLVFSKKAKVSTLP